MSVEQAGRYPVEFSEWPHARRIDFVAYSYTRGGLVATVLSQSGVDISERDIKRDEYLTKNDLAAIQLALEGYV